MLGAIIGDIVGSRYEFNNISHKDFEFFHPTSTFTDDTVLTAATADVLVNGGDYLKKYQSAYFDNPNRGWGGHFLKLASSGNLKPYGSYGNGSAMRVSPVGWAFDDIRSILREARATAEVTHDHPEGIKGAQAIAAAIFFARHGATKADILDEVSQMGYDLISLSDWTREFNETCQGTIPLCMAIFNESDSYEDCIRTAIAAGGDCDTTACIAGGIAEAFYGKPSDEMIEKAYQVLPTDMGRKVTAFVQKYVYKDFLAPDANMTDEQKLQDAF